MSENEISTIYSTVCISTGALTLLFRTFSLSKKYTQRYSLPTFGFEDI